LIAFGLCAVYFVGASLPQWGFPVTHPDSLYYAGVARNLSEGNGYQVDALPYYMGAVDSLRHTPELHGFLRPFELMPLFSAFGSDEKLQRLLGFFYTALCGLVAFAMARRIFGPHAGLAACVMTLASRQLFIFSAWGLDDAGYAFYFLCSINFLHLGLTRDRQRYFLFAGMAAGVGLLEKLVGAFVPLVFSLVALRWRRDGTRALVERSVLLLGPVVLAVGAYLLRNYVAHGDISSRLSALSWVYRAHGLEVAFAVYDEPISTLALLKSIGWQESLGLVTKNFAVFWQQSIQLGRGGSSLFTTAPWPLVLCAFASLALHWRRQADLLRLVLASLLSSLLFISLLYHVEARYFAMLNPLYAVAASGLFAPARAGWGEAARSLPAWVPRLAGAGLVLAMSLAFIDMGVSIAAGRDRELVYACPGGDAWIREKLGPEERIFTAEAERLAWETRRQTLVIPSGGLGVVFDVAERYSARWLLIHRTVGRPDLSSLLTDRSLQSLEPPRRLERVFREGGCSLFRLDWRPRRELGAGG
jgi:4-amino-4-deoxy-L-arabinose transferase-like glycosyltransferase